MQTKIKLIDELLTKSMFSGSLLIAEKDQILISKGYAFSDYEFDIPNTENTLFRIASITKQMTAAAIMQLIEKKKLNLNDTLNQFIEDYPNGDKITIYHLLTNSSGIANFELESDFYDVYHAKSFDEALINLFKFEPLLFKPGSQFSYSISGYLLLGYIIKKVSGMLYEDYLDKHLFKPLKMNHSGFDHWRKIVKQRAKNYDFIDEQIVHAEFLDMRIAGAGGGLYSTTGDLFLWQQGLLNNTIMNEESYQMMFTPQIMINEYVSYGYGAFLAKAVIVDKMRRKNYHTGGGPGVRSMHTYYPDDQITFILTSNINDRNTFNQTEEKIEEILLSK